MASADTQAITPDLDPIVPDSLDEVAQTQEAQQNTLDASTQALANLGADAGYQELAKGMQKYIDDFRSGRSIIFDTNTDVSVIGQKYVVASTVASVLQEWLDKVTNAQKAVAANNGITEEN